MSNLNYNMDNLPVLTEIADSGALTLRAQDADVVAVKLSICEPEPGGYDPYNNAPPVPADKTSR